MDLTWTRLTQRDSFKHRLWILQPFLFVKVTKDRFQSCFSAHRSHYTMSRSKLFMCGHIKSGQNCPREAKDSFRKCFWFGKVLFYYWKAQESEFVLLVFSQRPFLFPRFLCFYAIPIATVMTTNFSTVGSINYYLILGYLIWHLDHKKNSWKKGSLPSLLSCRNTLHHIYI